MERLLSKLAMAFAASLICACQMAPPPPATREIPGAVERQLVRERLSAVVVTQRDHLGAWAKRKFSIENAPEDADGGSATPITHDGYFLTADHVLATAPGRNVFVIYGRGGDIVLSKARVVWRSAPDDLAILHIPISTPFHYQWSAPDRWLTSGARVIHGGMATGLESEPGKLSTDLSPESRFTGNRRFKIDIPLRPGDSGGPVIDASGKLIGINSAVEYLIPMETAIFLDSEGNRPSLRFLNKIIAEDRRRRAAR
jgi:S1-C subfamily serine protease